MLISVGLGWSVLPKSMLDDSLAVISVPNVRIERQLGAIHHVQRTLSNSGKAFLKCLEEDSDNERAEGF